MANKTIRFFTTVCIISLVIIGLINAEPSSSRTEAKTTVCAVSVVMSQRGSH